MGTGTKTVRPFRLLASIAVIMSLAVLLAFGATHAADAPAFEDYPVSERFDGDPAPLNLSSDNWSSYSADIVSYIKQDMARGPNFAGYYYVAELGCGTACQVVVAIDLRDGSSIFVNEAARYGAEVHVDSALLVLQADPVAGTPAGYFLLDGGGFRKLD